MTNAIDFSCKVCGEPSECKLHYGVICCHGCKAFFRRTVRMELVYHCRQGGGCVVRSDQRNTCRYCRYQKCLKAGMRKNSVQKQRDSVQRRVATSTDARHSNSQSPAALDRGSVIVAASPSSCSSSRSSNTATAALQITEEPMPPTSTANGGENQMLNNWLSIDYKPVFSQTLQQQMKSAEEMQKDNIMAYGRAVFGHQNAAQMVSDSIANRNGPAGTRGGYLQLLRENILALVLQLRMVDTFNLLTLPDKMSVVRSHSTEFAILTAFERSANIQDLVKMLFGDDQMARDFVERVPGVRNVISGIIENVIEPFQRLQISEIEYRCIKAIALWNPDVVSSQYREIIRSHQQTFIVTLESHRQQEPRTNSPGRFGAILLLLKSLQSCGHQMKEVVQIGEMLGLVCTDPLVEDAFRDVRAVSSGYLAQALSNEPMASSPDLSDPISATIAGLNRVAANNLSLPARMVQAGLANLLPPASLASMISQTTLAGLVPPSPQTSLTSFVPASQTNLASLVASQSRIDSLTPPQQQVPASGAGVSVSLPTSASQSQNWLGTAGAWSQHIATKLPTQPFDQTTAKAAAAAMAAAHQYATNEAARRNNTPQLLVQQRQSPVVVRSSEPLMPPQPQQRSGVVELIPQRPGVLQVTPRYPVVELLPATLRYPYIPMVPAASSREPEPQLGSPISPGHQEARNTPKSSNSMDITVASVVSYAEPKLTLSASSSSINEPIRTQDEANSVEQKPEIAIAGATPVVVKDEIIAPMEN